MTAQTCVAVAASRLFQLGYEPERAHRARELGQMHQRARAPQIVASDRHIDVEQVLPGSPADRARLDLGQVDVAQREDRSAP